MIIDLSARARYDSRCVCGLARDSHDWPNLNHRLREDRKFRLIRSIHRNGIDNGLGLILDPASTRRPIPQAVVDAHQRKLRDPSPTIGRHRLGPICGRPPASMSFQLRRSLGGLDLVSDHTREHQSIPSVGSQGMWVIRGTLPKARQ